MTSLQEWAREVVNGVKAKNGELLVKLFQPGLKVIGKEKIGSVDQAPSELKEIRQALSLFVEKEKQEDAHKALLILMVNFLIYL